MAINLLELLSGAAGPQLVQTLSGFLGEKDSAIQSGITKLLPVLLGGMASKASTSAGASHLFSMLTGPSIDPGLGGDVNRLLASGQTGPLLGLGSTLMSGLFGTDKASWLGSALADVSGMKAASAGSLISVALPLVFSTMKRLIGEQRLDAPGVASLLIGQKDRLAGLLDPKLTSAVGLGNPTALLAGIGAGAASAVQAPVAAAATAAASMRWLPWVLGLGAVAVLALLISRCSPTAPSATNAAVTAPAETALPAKIYFETGAADIGAEGQAKLKAVAALLAAKTAVKVDLTGYTDKTGDTAANETLAKNRALAVKAALQAAGIAETRIGTKPPLFVEIGPGGSSPEARRVEITTQ